MPKLHTHIYLNTTRIPCRTTLHARTANYAKAMVADVESYIKDMKAKYNDLRDSMGKIPLVQLKFKVDECTAAVQVYDTKVTPLKKAMAANKPKKVKTPKAKAAAPQAEVSGARAAVSPCVLSNLVWSINFEPMPYHEASILVRLIAIVRQCESYYQQYGCRHAFGPL